jgi:hypothetical protein
MVAVGATLALAISPARVSADAWSYRDEMLYTDLVVRGIVQKTEGMRVPVQDYMPGDPRPDVTIPVSVVTLQVLEVLKGHHKGAMLTFVVPGGEPGSPVGLADLSYDLAPGEEEVFSLVFWKPMRGGSYMLRSDLGRWDRSAGKWVNREDAAVSVSKDEINAMVEPGQPAEMFRNADLVVVGTIEGIHPEKRGAATVETVSVRVVESWKGEAGGTVDFQAVSKGGFDLAWWRPVPKLSRGEQWVFFLKKLDGGYFPFAGTNGLLRVVDGRLLQNNAIDYGVSKEELKQRLERGERHDRQE